MITNQKDFDNIKIKVAQNGLSKVREERKRKMSTGNGKEIY